MKPADQLSPADFTEHCVWEFGDDTEAELTDETYMRPVATLPVTTLASRLVGTQLTLANGQQVFGMLGNIDLADPISTEHFLALTVFNRGERFDLARYHDVDYGRRDAVALAAFLVLPLNSVFPIRYDITGVAVGNSDCLRRSIPAVPISRLSQEDLIGLALK
jgi:hypothetical protein